MNRTATGRFFPLACAFYLALAVVGIVGFGALRGALGIEVWIDPGTWWIDLGIGLGLGAAMLGLWTAMVRLAPGARRVEAELRARLGPLARAEAAALALVSALAEEVAFRGALQSWLGWFPAAILFALAHWAPAPHFRWWTLWALAGGLTLGYVTAGRGTLAAAIVAHVVINGVQLLRFAHAARSAHAGPGASGAAAPKSGAAAPGDPTSEPPTAEVPEEILIEMSSADRDVAPEEANAAEAAESEAEPSTPRAEPALERAGRSPAGPESGTFAEAPGPVDGDPTANEPAPSAGTAAEAPAEDDGAVAEEPSSDRRS